MPTPIFFFVRLSPPFCPPPSHPSISSGQDRFPFPFLDLLPAQVPFLVFREEEWSFSRKFQVIPVDSIAALLPSTHSSRFFFLLSFLPVPPPSPPARFLSPPLSTVPKLYYLPPVCSVKIVAFAPRPPLSLSFSYALLCFLLLVLNFRWSVAHHVSQGNAAGIKGPVLFSSTLSGNLVRAAVF